MSLIIQTLQTNLIERVLILKTLYWVNAVILEVLHSRKFHYFVHYLQDFSGRGYLIFGILFP